MPNYDLGTAKGKIVIDSSDAVRGIKDADRAMGQYRDEQGRLRDQSSQFVKDQDQIGQSFQKQSMSVEQAGSTLQSTGLVMMGMGGAAVAGFGVAVKAASDFEKVMSGVSAVSGASEKDIDKLRKKALELGADTKFSATEAGLAMEELVKAGLSVEDVLNGAADAAVYLAAAGEIDLASAASIASAAMNNFNMEASELPRVADLIAGAANASAIDVSDFGMSLQQSGAAANLAGLSFEDLALGIAAMGNAGIKGSDAGTSLKTMLMNLNPTSKKQIELFRELGIMTEDGANAFFTMEGKAKSLTEIAGVLQAATAGMTDQQKLMALETMFGSDAIRAAAVVANEGAAGFEELSKQMNAVTAQEVAEKRMDNLAGAVEELKGAFETLLIQTGSPFQNVFKKAVQILASFVGFISELPGPIQTIIASLVLAVGSLLLFAGAGSFALGTVLKFVGGLKEFRAALIVVKNMHLLTRATAALNAVLAVNPIILIIAAIVALGVALYALYKKNETFRKFVDGLWQSIQQVWDKILDFFRELPEHIGKALDWVKEKISRAINWIKNNWDLLLPIFLGPLGLIIVVIRRWGDDILDFFKSLPTRIKNGISRLWDGVVSIFKEFPGNVIEFVTGGIDKIVDTFLGIPKRLVGGVSKLGEGVGNFISGLFGGGNEAEKEAEMAGNRVIAAINGIKSRMREVGDYRNGKWYVGDVAVGYSADGNEDGGIILDNVQYLTDELGKVGDYRNGTWYIGDVAVAYADNEDSEIILQDLDAIQKETTATKTKFDEIRDSIAGFFSTVGETVASFFRDLPDNFDNFINEAKKKIITFAIELPGKAREAGSNFLNGIMEFLSKLPERIGFVIGLVIGSVVRFALDMLSKAAELGSNFVTGVMNFLQTLPGKIGFVIGLIIGSVTKFVVDMVQKAWELGSRFVTSIVSWLSQLPGRVAGFILGVLATLISLVPQIIGKAIELGAGVLNGIVNFVQHAPGRFGSFISQLPGIVWNAARDAGSAAWDLGSRVLNGVVGFITDIPNKVKNIFIDAINGVKGLVSRAFNAAKDFGSGLWNGFKRGMGIASPSYIEKAMFAMNDNVSRESESLKKHLGSLISMGEGLPTSFRMEAAAGSKAMVGELAPTRLLAGGSAVYPSNNDRGGTSEMTLNLEINNPVGEPTETSIHREMQKLAIHGVLPPIGGD